ncbi:MAG TPA: 50S ribosomal protein L11 methyltransferase [Bryobacteraceae bacterium]|nr:50S ribosomal protein L11 methyltransferase [Bryobacteraceae bacterium]
MDEHRLYLDDPNRISPFSKAIAEVVKPGDVVLDLASGTGILGLMACRAGAARVYSIEVGGMVEVVRAVAKANGYGDRVVAIKGFSTHVDLPEKVDVLVADQIGNFGFNAGVLAYFADARQRFLKPSAVTIPARLDLCLAAVQSEQLYDQVEFWDKSPGGFDFHSVRVLAANTGYQANLEPSWIVSDIGTLPPIDLCHASMQAIEGDAVLKIQRNAMLHGLGGWFTAELSPGVSMTNSPLSEQRIQRRQVFFAIDQPVSVDRGDTVRVRMKILPGDLLVNWNVDVFDGPGGAKKTSFRHSTWKAMLLTKEEMERSRPDFFPKLTPRGIGRRTVVELCDGTRPLKEIEDEVFQRHPELFPSRTDAAVFVAEVVTRYTE